MSFTIHDHRSRQSDHPSHFTWDNRIPCVARELIAQRFPRFTRTTMWHFVTRREECEKSKKGDKACSRVGTEHSGTSSQANGYPLTHAVLEKAFPFRCICIRLCELIRQRALDIPRRSDFRRFVLQSIQHFPTNNLISGCSDIVFIWFFYRNTKRIPRDSSWRQQEILIDKTSFYLRFLFDSLNPSRKGKLYFTDIRGTKILWKTMVDLFDFIISRIIRNRTMLV